MGNKLKVLAVVCFMGFAAWSLVSVASQFQDPRQDLQAKAGDSTPPPPETFEDAVETVRQSPQVSFGPGADTLHEWSNALRQAPGEWIKDTPEFKEYMRSFTQEVFFPDTLANEIPLEFRKDTEMLAQEILFAFASGKTDALDSLVREQNIGFAPWTTGQPVEKSPEEVANIIEGMIIFNNQRSYQESFNKLSPNGVGIIYLKPPYDPELFRNSKIVKKWQIAEKTTIDRLTDPKRPPRLTALIRWSVVGKDGIARWRTTHTIYNADKQQTCQTGAISIRMMEGDRLVQYPERAKELLNRM